MDPRPALLTPLAREELANRIVATDPPPLRYDHGSRDTLSVEITNESDSIWPVFTGLSDRGYVGYLQCVVGMGWRSPDSAEPRWVTVPLPRNLGPGESARLPVKIAPPRRRGTYELWLTVFQIQRERAVNGTVWKLPVRVK